MERSVKLHPRFNVYIHVYHEMWALKILDVYQKK